MVLNSKDGELIGIRLCMASKQDIMVSSTLFDLRSQLRFYKYYHHNKVNVLIHSVFVPTILFSSCCMLHRVILYRGVTLTHVLSVCFSVFYILLYVPTGLLATAMLIFVNVALDKKWIHMSFTKELSLFVLGWVFQFIGHGVFEKKKPALFDNLVQSLVLAPYFILFELLFKLGLMPELKNQLESDVREMDQELLR